MGFHQTVEKIETIFYAPSSQDTGDLEAGTHTIVPTARPAIGAAQYSSVLTLPDPDDARLVVDRIMARLAVTIAGLGTAANVYCSVRVDVDDADHELFLEDWTSTGAKLDAVDTHAAAKAAIFALLKDGAAHTFYFLFWADAASQATINLVNLWEGVGSIGAFYENKVAHLTHKGFATINMRPAMGAGSGSAGGRLVSTDAVTDSYTYYASVTNNDSFTSIGAVLVSNPWFTVGGSVATDLNVMQDITIVLRSEG